MRIFTVRVKNRQQEKKVRAALKLVDAEKLKICLRLNWLNK